MKILKVKGLYIACFKTHGTHFMCISGIVKQDIYTKKHGIEIDKYLNFLIINSK